MIFWRSSIHRQTMELASTTLTDVIRCRRRSDRLSVDWSESSQPSFSLEFSSTFSFTKRKAKRKNKVYQFFGMGGGRGGPWCGGGSQGWKGHSFCKLFYHLSVWDGSYFVTTQPYTLIIPLDKGGSHHCMSWYLFALLDVFQIQFIF